MTREQINTIFTDLGLETPNKGVVNALLNAFNQEKGTEIDNAKKTAKDEAEAKYKDFVKPEDHQKLVDELNAEKGKGALAERKAKYQAKNLNIDDEDILTLIESKLKDSKDFEKDLDEYVKAHPSFVKVTEKKEPKKPETAKVTLGGAGNEDKSGQSINPGDMLSAVNEHYNTDKK
ncbi:MAG: hypothetical protein IKP50_03850 [Bacilli bacterium]|nr:hypothetical protein [Bacilli bacterium]